MLFCIATGYKGPQETRTIATPGPVRSLHCNRGRHKALEFEEQGKKGVFDLWFYTLS
jgi:hypothetical protein